MNNNKLSCQSETIMNQRYMLSRSGFTLIELMITVAIVAIIAAIAIPSYDVYIRRADLATAQQEMLKVAALLEKHRARNFSYDGFVLKGTATNQGAYYAVPTATNTSLLLPLNASSGDQKFSLTLTVNSQAWSLQAVSQSPRNYSLLMTSTGFKCKTKTVANMTSSSCGNSAEDW
ncbi:prepilin-type N-terminal cleavage/methylation domain-containing protein [Acinetobacter colistiniresistens]|uniref:Prepilin-type N-terminal cleavage/methylation domain-containing protein n=2 Tax=Acinetobacter colistiniresistens TaxID=280145 RepID=A0A558F8F3_9GAMM|nr:prepilin-type N-terminal cleavage/methylation domain-containing protein [Acinetobacter colistiniresistens]